MQGGVEGEEGLAIGLAGELDEILIGDLAAEVGEGDGANGPGECGRLSGMMGDGGKKEGRVVEGREECWGVVGGEGADEGGEQLGLV